MTEVADWFAQQGKIGAARTATVLGNDPRSPDALADQAKIAGQLGIPPIVVGSDPAAYKARAEQKSLIDALADAPKTAAWLSNRDNGGLAKDDVENLSWFEKGLKDFGDMGDNFASRGIARGIKSAYGNMRGQGAIQSAIQAGDIGLTLDQLIEKETAAIPDAMRGDPAWQYAAQQAGAAKYDMISGMDEADKSAMLSAAADQMKAAREIVASAAKIARSETGQAFLEGAWAKADSSFMGVVGAISEDPLGAIAFLGDTAAESLPMMVPAAIATAVTKSPAVGAAVMGGTSFAATSSSETMDFLDQRGIKMGTPEEAMATLSDQDLMREAQQYGVDKGLIVAALDAISGGVAGKTLARTRIGDWLLQSLSQAGLGAGGEALAEYAVDGKLDWKQVIVEGLAELVTAPAEVASMGRDWLKSTSSRKESGRAADALSAIDAKASASKVKARTPEAFNAAMAEILGGKSVYVPAEEMETYFQAKDMSFDPADWGIDQTAYDAARLSGGKVAVPAASYAAKISGTDDAAWFHEHASATIDDDMSVAEARAFDETKAELLAEAGVEQEKILAEERELMPVETEIYDTMVSRNLAAGMSSDVAQTNALLFPKLFSTLAARAGVNIAELARRYALPLVEGAIPNGARPRTVDGLSRALAELRGRKSAGGAKTPLLDFIRDRGGVDDVGGELATRNADAGRKPFQKRLLRKKSDEGKPLALTQAEMASGKRFGLDDTAQAAIEAGFMAGNPAVIEWKNAQEKGDRVAPDLIPVLLAEIDRELSGGVTDQNSADLDGMEEYLNSLGVTLDNTDAEIRAAIEAAQAGYGKMYAQDGEIRTTSAAFKEWFGDSKVVDADGNPLVVYHGTAADFDAFSKSADPKHIDLPGFFFTPDASVADGFSESASRKPFRDDSGYIAGFEGAAVVPVYLSIQNPAEINLSDRETGRMTRSSDVQAMLEQAQSDGHDGAVIRGWSDGSGEVQWVAFQPNQIKSVFNRGTWDARDARILYQGSGSINGQIRFPINGLRNGESIISLFKSANLSTFLHETGHYFLEVFADLASDSDAPDTLKSDLAAVHEWLGSAPGKPFTVQQHEQFARGIEAYLMEGKAPSTALARAFEKFRAWLESVYKTAVALNVNLTPEIRAVFDRMIATDAEIADAKADIGDHVLTSAADLGMTPETYARFVQLTQDANAEAAAKLRAETMAPIRRAREKEYREERAKVIAEVTPEMQARPVYRATQEMRFGKGFDGEPVAAMKLDRAAIERDFGAGHIPFLPGATKDGKGHAAAVFGPSGIHPDQAASAYGFETGADLLQALEEAPPIKEAITAEADRIMFERHGDVLNDGSVEEMALDALHGDKRAQALDMEATALERLSGEAGGRKAKLVQIKAAAHRTLAGSMVKDAIASHRYVAAAKKAGDAAFRAIVRKDFASSAAQKRRQIMNHAFYVESRKVSAAVDGIIAKVSKLNKPDARLGKARDIDHVKAARAIAARFGLAKPDTAFDFMAWVEQMKFDDPATADAMMSAIEIYGADAKPFNDLTVDQLGAVSDAIDSVLAAGRHARMLEIEGKQVDRQEAEDALLAVIEERGSRDNAADRGAMSKVQRLMAGMKDLTSSTRASLRVVEIWARTMDGGEQGPFTKYLVRPVMDALGEYFTARKARMDAVLEIVKGADLTGKAIAAPELRANGDQPFTFQNKAALLHALLHTGNESNKAKMLIGWRFSDGFANPQQAVTAKGKLRVKRDGTAIMTKGELDTTRWDAFLARMFSQGVITAKDIALVNAIWAQFEETKRPAQATFKKLNGHYFKEVENAPYDTPAGRLNGGYVPAMIDRAVSLDAGRQADLKTLDQTAASMFPTTGKGFTKSRVENYREPLELNLMLIPSHLDSVLRFTYLEPTIRQTSGLLTRRSLRDKLQAFDPALVGDTLMPWLQRTASRSISSVDGTQGKRKWGRAFDRLRGRVGISIMFLNVVNTLQQVTGPIVAMNEVSPKKIGMALVRFASGGAFQMRDAIKEASPYMKERLRLVANDSLIAIEDLVRDKGILTSVDQFTQKHGYIIQSAFQNVLDIVVWHAGYDDAVAKGLPHESAVFEADSHVRRSMPDSAPENVTAFAQGGATWRAITMFSAFFISQANLIGSSASLIRRQMGWKGAPKAFWAYLTLFAIPALLSQAITDAATGGGPDDEDDDGWADDLAAWFGMTQLKYGLAMAPLAGKAVLAGINSFNDNPVDDRLSVSPVVSAFETAARAVSSISGAITGDKSARRATLDGLQVVAMMTGIPTGQLSKTLGYGIGTAEGRYAPQGQVDVMQGVVSGRDGTE